MNTLEKVPVSARFAPNQEAAWPHLRTVDGELARADVVPGKEARTHDTYNIAPQEGWFAVRNSNRDLGFAMSWDHDVYPYLWTWQVYGGAWNYPYYGRAYALALEPFSSPAGTLAANVERGTARTLVPGEDLELRLCAGFFVGAQRPVTRVTPDGLPETQEI